MLEVQDQQTAGVISQPDVAVGYIRVSTGRQAERDLSIPVQQEKIEKYCRTEGLDLVQVFSDKGKSGRNPKRPGLQALMQYALDPQNGVKVVVFYNFSRFMRRLVALEGLVEQLEEAGVTVTSTQQPIENNASGRLLRRSLASIDEYDSDIKAEVTLDNMKRNAQNGYWNGSPPPFGYTTKVVEMIGNRAKSKLAINPAEAPIVRIIFNLYLVGDGTTGPLGCTALSRCLEQKGYSNRQGNPFSAKQVNSILGNETYAGVSTFNKGKGRKQKPEREWIRCQVPAIISSAIFADAQKRLADQNPNVTGAAPRRLSSPLLLSGLVKCGSCGQCLNHASGKGYLYYSCRHAQERTGCLADNIATDKLDKLVLDAVCARALTAGRLTSLVNGICEFIVERNSDLRREIDGARHEREDVLRQIDKYIEQLTLTKLELVHDRIQEKLRYAAEQRILLEQRIGELTAKMEAVRKRPSKTIVSNFAAGLRHCLAKAPAPAVRAWLATQITSIRVTDGLVQVMYR